MIYGAKSKLDLPTVGDWVFVEYFDKNTFAVIQEVLSRYMHGYQKRKG